MLREFRSGQYEKWHRKLKDLLARQRIDAKIYQIKQRGEFVGDCKSVGDGVTEVRFDIGPGYRVYAAIEEKELLLLLVGGKKARQQEDIAMAKSLLRDWRGQDGEDPSGQNDVL